MSDSTNIGENIEIMSLSSFDESIFMPPKENESNIQQKKETNIPKKKDRRHKYDKQISMKKKKILKEKKYFKQHD